MIDDNAFSKTWCELFLRNMPDVETRRDTEFIQRHMPRPEYRRLLDVACGVGRHACALAEAGYDVLGIDRSPALIAEATRSTDRARFEVVDMCQVSRLDGAFDGILSLWHSFGFHDAATNQAVLEQFGAKLRPRGRAILDVYNRDHAIHRPRVEQTRRADVSIETRRSWLGPRLTLELWYDGVLGDRFDWHLYSPDELRAACAAAGFDILLACAHFDESVPASSEWARMQLLLERR
ncbi:MAG TPA: class I SAM-dependent methyltransferase [Polyangiaceae bacterium]|nr:class I SAM-dependent methyltransferase [Polyangiaceae bacterium]